MRSEFLYFLILLTVQSCTPDRPGEPPLEPFPVPTGYRLVWSDEFDRGSRPDTTNWSYERGFVRNREDQWYQEDNARVENGFLVIEGRRERKPNPTHRPGSDDWRHVRPEIEYTSSSINTRGKGEWRYGRFEMRGKIPVGQGIWPAWWTLGTQGDWPGNGEIDIMEYYQDQLLANIASRGADGQALWFDRRIPLDSLGGAQWADQFHVWRMDWDENAIALYVDDSLLNRQPMEELANRDGSNFHPFRQPHYMLLNLALGGTNGGPLEEAQLPARLVVDYVRVYQPE
ncbi:glycoside hydrolase family 16 protein [Neolewinella litorea]|uniref:Glycoside hydrolase family 16 protein n=1 Tax=Neolewinella litorea TaxID=2562452 RepID=A0A4S4NTN4_9BACT|nr:glycoside hydrolase family 16 protein [Neolewinella litorea]THH41828.1 glycoside hydrolase family 16 protein [Neolewinella litorea]